MRSYSELYLIAYFQICVNIYVVYIPPTHATLPNPPRHSRVLFGTCDSARSVGAVDVDGARRGNGNLGSVGYVRLFAALHLAQNR